MSAGIAGTLFHRVLNPLRVSRVKFLDILFNSITRHRSNHCDKIGAVMNIERSLCTRRPPCCFIRYDASAWTCEVWTTCFSVRLTCISISPWRGVAMEWILNLYWMLVKHRYVLLRLLPHHQGRKTNHTHNSNCHGNCSGTVGDNCLDRLTNHVNSC